MKLNFLVLLSLVCQVFLGTMSFSQEESELEVGIIEQLDSIIPAGITLVSENGDTLELIDLLDKPTVLSLVYFRCPGICTPLMDGLASVIKKTDMLIGTDYQVVTVSFNPREGPELAKRKKDNYLNFLNMEEVQDGWTFYTADSSDIAELTKSVGFYYKQAGNDYTHTGTLIFLSEEGKITRYLNGTQFLPFEFKMALLETSRGQSGPTINKVLQYCYSYDPKGQAYVLNITRVAGIIITFILSLLFISLLLLSVFKKRQLKTN